MTVWRYEHGDNAGISVAIARRIATLCGVSAAWLMTGEGEPRVAA